MASGQTDGHSGTMKVNSSGQIGGALSRHLPAQGTLQPSMCHPSSLSAWSHPHDSPSAFCHLFFCHSVWSGCLGLGLTGLAACCPPLPGPLCSHVSAFV